MTETHYSGCSNKARVGCHCQAPADPPSPAVLIKENEAVAIIAMPTDRPSGPRRAERQQAILRGLERIAAERETLRRQEDELIDWARDEAVPWAEIAGAVGMSTEGARVAYTKRQRARRGEAATCP